MISTIQISNCSTRSNRYQFKFSILFSCVRNLIFEQNRVESCGRFFQWHITKYCCKGIHTSLPFSKMFRIRPRRPVVKRIIDLHSFGNNAIKENYILSSIRKIMKNLLHTGWWFFLVLLSLCNLYRRFLSNVRNQEIH